VAGWGLACIQAAPHHAPGGKGEGRETEKSGEAELEGQAAGEAESEGEAEGEA